MFYWPHLRVNSFFLMHYHKDLPCFYRRGAHLQFWMIQSTHEFARPSGNVLTVFKVPELTQSLAKFLISEMILKIFKKKKIVENIWIVKIGNRTLSIWNMFICKLSVNYVYINHLLVNSASSKCQFINCNPCKICSRISPVLELFLNFINYLRITLHISRIWVSEPQQF